MVDERIHLDDGRRESSEKECRSKDSCDEDDEVLARRERGVNAARTIDWKRDPASPKQDSEGWDETGDDEHGCEHERAQQAERHGGRDLDDRPRDRHAEQTLGSSCRAGPTLRIEHDDEWQRPDHDQEQGGELRDVSQAACAVHHLGMRPERRGGAGKRC